MADYRLKSYEFRRERQSDWEELSELLDRAAKGLGTLTSAELYRLPALYRAVLSSLSVARAISLDKNVVAYLEDLAARAFVVLYGTQHGLLQAIRTFFTHWFPRRVRSLSWGVLLSIGLLILGAASGFMMTIHDSERFYSFVPSHLAGDRTPASTAEDLLDALKGRGVAEELTLFATSLFTHNTSVGFLCFAIGVAFGVPVALLVFYNGLILGAFAAIYYQQGLALPFWAWVLPHGVTELLAVCICGATGFAIGQSLIFPGPYSRLENLARRGRDAASVAAGAAALFFLAALLEGFFRQMVHHEAVRLTVALATAIGWVAYFSLAGRGEEP
ncbi:MAG: stage II sporulation protein M [Deltaproteobacteria bacterium]|nr:stage II sporulation protein M [Deltaproteobacteria bacterium]